MFTYASNHAIFTVIKGIPKSDYNVSKSVIFTPKTAMTRPKSKIGAMFEPATHRLLGYALTY